MQHDLARWGVKPFTSSHLSAVSLARKMRAYIYPLGFHCGIFRERIPTRARLLPLFSQADGYSAIKRISFEDSGNVLSLGGFAVDTVHG